MRKLVPSVIIALVCLPTIALGHYPWFMVDQSPARKDTVTFVFEEGPALGDGQYLDPFIKSASYWLRTADKQEPAPLSFQERKGDGKRWLTFTPAGNKSRAIDCYCKWGVYQGKLLHYYARHLDVASPDHLASLGRAEKLRYDLVPRIDDGAVEVRVLWDGKPAPGKSVNVNGPGFRTTATADDKGLIRFKPEKPGLYTLRSMFIEAEPEGTDDGKSYKGLRHTATMTISLPIPAAAAGAK